jgi:hypothetical protein
MNAKISETDTGLKWSDFRGFSILFDNGKAHYIDNLLANNLENSNYFYIVLNDVFGDFAEKNEVLNNPRKFMQLDFRSWHVTVWDGINKGNFGLLNTDNDYYFSRFMNSLKYSDIHHDIRALIDKSIRWMNTAGEIRFAFRKLYNYENQVLVVSLKPADIDSLEKLHKIKLIRRNLNSYFEENFGFATGKRYLPHSSLGYFVEEDYGKEFRPNQDKLNSILEKALKGLTLSFSKVKLFGFSDMVSFHLL